MSSSVLPRKLIILAIVLPIAAFLGFSLADPNFQSWGLVGLIAGVLCLPLLLKWHHPLLIFSWSFPITLFFLPGNPLLWMPLAFLSLGISFLGTVMDKEQRLTHVPMLTISMICLALVVLFTMKMTGGLGLRSLGSSAHGGRKYFFMLFAIVGYFAISCQRLPLATANRQVGSFFLSGIGSSFGNIIYFMGSGVWFLYYLFPAEWALIQAYEDFSGDAYSLRSGRLGGFSVAGIAVFSYLLARYGIRGCFEFRKIWRAALLFLAVFLGLLGGFRSVLATYILLFGVQFFLEGLHRSRALPALAIAGLVGFAALIPFSTKLPLSVQRCLTVLPVEVHPAIRADAAGSTQWRLAMWRAVMPEIPKYFWLGKGYSTSGSEMYLTAMAARLGMAEGYESSMAGGDYHNGPLSLIIPFGIWGVLAFLFMVGTSLRVLYLNHRHGDPSLRHINCFLLTAFIARVIYFLFVFGVIHTDVPILAGLIGLSVSLNGGVCRRRALVSVPAPEPAPTARTRPRRWMPIRA